MIFVALYALCLLFTVYIYFLLYLEYRAVDVLSCVLYAPAVSNPITY